METVIAINAALALAEALIPRIKELAAKGEISAEQQAEVLRRFESLRSKSSGEFQGAHWQVV